MVSSSNADLRRAYYLGMLGLTNTDTHDIDYLENLFFTTYPNGLGGSYVRLVAPTSVPTSTVLANSYIAQRYMYNWKPSNTHKIKSAVGKAAAASTTTGAIGTPTAKPQFSWWGDSETSGVQASTLASIPFITARVLAENVKLVLAGTSGNASDSTGTTDNRWSFGSGWGLNSLFKSWNSSAASGTFTYESSATNVDLSYYNNSGQFVYTVKDSGGSTIATATVTPTGANSLGQVKLTGLTDAKSVVIAPAGGASGFFIGADFYNTTGLMTYNFGASGSTTGNWIDGTTFASRRYTAAIMCPSPDVVFISLSANDAINSVAVATTAANLATIVTAAKALASAPDVVLVTQAHMSSVAFATWQTYVAANYAVADSADIPLVDACDLLGTYTIANANGLMGNVIHPNAAGYTKIAQLIASACAT